MFRSAAVLAEDLGNPRIVAFTRSGFCRGRWRHYDHGVFRPMRSPYVEVTFRQLLLPWGVEPFLMDFSDDPEQTILRRNRRFTKTRLGGAGSCLVVHQHPGQRQRDRRSSIAAGGTTQEPLVLINMGSNTKIQRIESWDEFTGCPIRHSDSARRALTGGISFPFVCVVAVAGYMAAGWRLDDSVYMVVITIFGVGYGEVQPIESPGLRALTIMVIIGGYGAVIYTIGGFMQMVIDGELNRAMGARRMTKGIERLSGHTIICGIGRLGTILARELHAAGQPFVAIDSDLERLQDAEERGYLVLHGDATEEDILEQAGIQRATTVAAVLSQTRSTCS